MARKPKTEQVTAPPIEPGDGNRPQPALPEEWLASIPEKEPLPPIVTVRVVAAGTAPVPLGLNGTFINVPLGRPTELPRAFLDALQNSGATFVIL